MNSYQLIAIVTGYILSEWGLRTPTHLLGVSQHPINNRLNADMALAREYFGAQIGRKPTREEISSYMIGEQEKICETYSRDKEVKKPAFKEVLRKFWPSRGPDI